MCVSLSHDQVTKLCAVGRKEELKSEMRMLRRASASSSVVFDVNGTYYCTLAAMGMVADVISGGRAEACGRVRRARLGE